MTKPFFPRDTVLKVLREAPKPLTLDELLAALTPRVVHNTASDAQRRQRIHNLVHDGVITAVQHPTKRGSRLYTAPQVEVAPAPKAMPVNVEAAPVPTTPSTPAPPTVDLSHAVDAIAQAVATALEAAIKDRIADVVRTQLQVTLDALPAQVLSLTGGTVSPASVKTKPAFRPRVTVVGLLPGQVEMISREYGAALDLHFVDCEHTNTKRLEGLCRSSHHVITMTNFINHAVEAIIKASGGNLIRVFGGMSSLRIALEGIINERETA